MNQAPSQDARDAGRPGGPIFIGIVFFWMFLVGSAFFLSALVVSGSAIGKSKRLYLDVSPDLVLIGIVISVISTVLIYVVLRKRSVIRQSFAIAAVPVVLTGLGVIVGGLAPGTQRLVDRDYVPTEPRRDTTRFAVPIFFENNKSQLRPLERQRLLQSIEIFVACKPSDVFAEGFASSTPFRRDLDDMDGKCNSKCQNTRLGERRALTIKGIVEKEANLSVRAQDWADYEAMIVVRRLRDEIEGGKSDVRAERLNRRGVLSWNQSTCGG